MKAQRIEFDCPQCGRHLVRFSGPDDGIEVTVCGACQAMPGWFTNPALAREIEAAERGHHRMSDDAANIPAEFWQSLSDAEWKEFAERDGFLTEKQCRRLWRMTDRQGPIPSGMQVFFNRADVERAFPSNKRRRK